jgi:hypothetical protein
VIRPPALLAESLVGSLLAAGAFHILDGVPEKAHLLIVLDTIIVDQVLRWIRVQEVSNQHGRTTGVFEFVPFAFARGHQYHSNTW